MYQFPKIFRWIIPVCTILILAGCGKTELDKNGNTEEISRKEQDQDRLSPEEAEITHVPFSESGEDKGESSEEVLNWEEMTVPELYYHLGDEIGFEYLGGLYYEAETDSHGIWLKQEAYDIREGRELTECELALEQKAEEGHLIIRIGKYSTAELKEFQDRVTQLLYDEEKMIYATGMNEVENKISVYANENADFEALYELVPEEAVWIEFMPGPPELIEL